MSERVTLRVDERDKEQWKEAVQESPEYESLTHLIELAVFRELNGMQDPTGGSSDGAAAGGYSPDVSNGEIQQAIKGLEADIDSLETDITAIRSETEAVGAGSLADRLYDLLPESEESAKSYDEMARALDVAGALIQLQDEIGHVKWNDREEFWKEV